MFHPLSYVLTFIWNVPIGTLFAPEGQSMDYSEVVSAFSRLVETHFLQRCPPMSSAGSSSSEAVDTPLPAVKQPTEPEDHPECYKLPYINLTGQLLQSKHLPLTIKLHSNEVYTVTVKI